MKLAVWKLIVAAAVFVVWLGYLLYLVLNTPKPFEVLSRPQFLVSDLDVVAQIDDPAQSIRVKRVLFAAKDDGKALEGREIAVANIADCRHLRSDGKKLVEKPDFTGPGEYLMPLRSRGERYEVVPTPPSPGFPFNGPPQPGPPRLYPANRMTLGQYGQIAKPH